MSQSHAVLKAFRLIHLYTGVFITPALLFFAFTGALQTFGLHESTPNSSYKPPAWAMTLAQIHKKQTIVIPPKRPMPKPVAADHTAAENQSAGEHVHGDHTAASTAAAAPAASPASAPLARTHHPLPLKIFFLLVSLGLFTSTLTGLYMAWKYTRNRIAIALLLLAGVVVPAALLLV
jgi:PepSY-associated TM region